MTHRALWRCLAFVALLHVVGWGLLVGVVAPEGYEVGGRLLGVGLGLTAYTLGMRHAFDADHIAAIDNTTRKLMADGQRPVAVGFWFALGHSSLVVVLAVLIAAGARLATTTLEWPRANQKPTDTGRLPSAISLRVVLSIAAMWSASKACRMPSV